MKQIIVDSEKLDRKLNYIFRTYELSETLKNKIREAVKKTTMGTVRTGNWMPLEAGGEADGYPVWEVWECSECGNELHEEEPPKYCCDCGAKMQIWEGDD